MNLQRLSPSMAFQVLEFKGPDAASFLLSQLTNQLPEAGQHQLQGYCSAKGRLLAILRLWSPGPERFLALLPKALAEQTAKRLRMFVLRAKVVITPLPHEVHGAWLHTAQPAPGEVLSLDEDGFALGVSAGPSGAARAWIITQASKPPAATEPSAARQDDWLAEDMACGQAWIWPETMEQFVPQMVNLELVGGVSFTKGCYPGQEVVARSHYLGKLKTRMFLVRWQGAAASPGQTVCDGAGEVQGDVVMSAQQGEHSLALISAQLDAWKAGGLMLCGSGTRLEPGSLPYEVPLSPPAPNRPLI
jgi:folate-binding protein YgfZ